MGVDLNLTPFIDLLSTMVCFLLIAAVWLQVGALEVKQSHGTEAPDRRRASYEMDLRLEGPTLAWVTVTRNGRRVRRIRARGEDFRAMRDDLERSLSAFLDGRGGAPHVSALTVTTRPSVTYGQLVESLDVFRSRSIRNIGIIPGPAGG